MGNFARQRISAFASGNIKVMIHSNRSSAILCAQSTKVQINLSHPNAFARRGTLSLICAENLQCTLALTSLSCEQLFYAVFVSQNTLTSHGVSIL